MGELKNILIVTNSATDAEVLQIKTALNQAREQELKVKVNLVHVIPSLPTCYFNIPSMVILAERYYEEAKESLTLVGNQLDVAAKDQWLITGKIKTEVIRLAHKLKTHYILASSSSIQDLRKPLFFRREQKMPVRCMSNTGIAF
jgi:hypothetical protein